MASISDIVHRFSDYDLTIDEKHNINRYIGKKDEAGDMADSLIKMQTNFRELIGNVSDASDQVAASSEELTAISDQSALGSEEVAKTIEELARSANMQARNTETGSEKIGELESAMKENHELVEGVSGASKRVANLIEEGMLIIDGLMEKTVQSQEAVKDIFGMIVRTNESSKKIGSASDVIASIAEQTNLLALNAAIEAARAGKSGRGFAVVADEIRNLAEQSTCSTKEIDSIVSELAKNANSAVEKMTAVGSLIQKQSQSVDETGGKYREISQAIGYAAESIAKMNASVEIMDDKKMHILGIVKSLSQIAEENAAGAQEASASTEEQSASIQEIADASESLSKLSQELQQAISKFKI
ncbi:methyl-accepting chemotaxis protein [Peptoclostridium litorale]|nr:methyl-accepting chemotaxis protein [Peptoclostridium litorale]